MLRFLREDVDLAKEVLLLKDDTGSSDSRPWSAVEAAQAKAGITAYSRHRVEIEVESPRDAYLVLSDYYHRNWFATVDGEPAGILRANFCARAVRVPSGSHTVVFSYSDPVSLAGLAVSITALLLAVALIAWPRRKKKDTADR